MDEEPSTSCGIKRSIPKELQDEVDVIAAKLPRVIVKSADLSDNEKRWLVVGICLHSVIAPALRNYVVPILTSFYNQLSCNHKIDTQIYPNHLQRYQPTNTYLNYEIINNNKAKHGCQQANYDYTIKNAVDLSKLFLQTHMVHYTVFDETCDSSALLGLIINIDQFTPVVKSDAEAVRRDIRNPWAHCDYTKWDASMYSTSFQLMEQLVTDLTMSQADKNQVIGELNKWELNGQSFLNGSTLGLELVNEISQQTQVLAEYTKQVARKTDNNLLRIKKELDNIGRTVQNEKVQFKKDTRRGFLKIQRKVMGQDNTLKNHETQFAEVRKSLSICACRDFHNVEINSWEEQEVMFCETSVVKWISQTFESEHSILIVGVPGIGKTMFMHHAALELHYKKDYILIPCSSMQDIVNHYKEDMRQMFVLDNICRQYTASSPCIENWIKNEETLKTILKKGKTKIVATCRLDIYNNKQFKESYTVFANILNLSVEYSREDKLAIGAKYLPENTMQKLKDQNVDFTPLMCYLYSKNEEFILKDFLRCPFETYQNEWERLKSFDPNKYCALFLCVIYNGVIKESLFDIYIEGDTKNKYVLENIYDLCGINRGTSRSNIKSVFDNINGTYVRKIGKQYRVIHDLMFDFMCCYFGQKDEMVRGILHYADIQVLNERTKLESSNTAFDTFSVVISKTHEHEYFERIKNEIQLGKLNQCFCNSQMEHEKYRVLFLKMLRSIDHNLIIVQVYPRNDLHNSFTHTKYADGSLETLDNDNSDIADDFDLTEGPFLASCSRGYFEIVQYFISKGADIHNCDCFNTPLTAACYGGDERIVKLLIDKGCNVNQAGAIGKTPLTVACLRGNEKIVQLLVERGSDVNQADGLQQTPLAAACIKGYEAIVQLLIDKGSDINYTVRKGQTPLSAACEGGNEKIVHLLLDKKCDINHDVGIGLTLLTAACIGGNEKIVQLLVNKECGVNEMDAMGRTPLTVACSDSNEKIVKLLIDKGSDVNQTDGNGETPLTAACWRRYVKLLPLSRLKESDLYRANRTTKTPLTDACRRRNDHVVQLLIDRGSEVNRVDSSKNTPLIAACSRGDLKTVQLLIDNGCYVNQSCGTGRTALVAACSGGNEKIVQLLIDNGSDPNQADVVSETPLTAACRGGNEKIVQLLIENKCDLNQEDSFRDTPLTAACGTGNETIAQLLIDKGCDVIKAGVSGTTPLVAACGGGNEKIVQLLLEKKCDVNQTDGKGDTPLITACRRRNELTVHILIDKGSDVNQADDFGRTPLKFACSEGHFKIAQLLIDNGSDINKVDYFGETLLQAACYGGNEKIVQLLINKGSDVNGAGSSGQTLLSAACNGQNKMIVQLLIDKGCDVNQADIKGQTPLIAACWRGNGNIVQLLIDKGCDVNQADIKGQTPLIVACSGGNGNIVQLLIDKGCDVNQADIKGQTPLIVACRGGNGNIVQLLIDKGCNVNQADVMRLQPLTAASSGQNEKIIQLILANASDMNREENL